MVKNLEQTVDKILEQTRRDIESTLSDSVKEYYKKLDDTLVDLEAEYDKIISDGKKEADKVEKQIVGSSDLEARNKELLVVEEAVERVFEKALAIISEKPRDHVYQQLIETLLLEATDALGSSSVTVYTSTKDLDTVKTALGNFTGATLSSNTISCLGGVRVISADGTMTFDNTLDARVSRLKSLIRKNIAEKFGVGI